MYRYLFQIEPGTQSKSVNRVVLLAVILCSLLILTLFISASAQNNALILSGGYIRLDGGTSATPVYLVIGQSNILGITRTAGHIISENQYNFVKWNAGTATGGYVYPFGVGAVPADYIPFTFNKTTAGSSDITVSTWATNQQNVPHPGISNVAACWKMTGIGDSVTSAIDRFWDIRSSATADLTFSYRGVENTTSAPQTDPFKAQHWNGSLWDASVGPGDAGVTSNIGAVGPVTGQTTFSPWVLTKSAAPLPIELLYFTAKWYDFNQTKALLEWQTISEINNDYFEIQRSDNAVNFETIGTKKGAGNSLTLLTYEFIDSDLPAAANTAPSTLYYRLKQVDYDGTYSFSNIEVINAKDNIDLIAIYPNPASDYLSYLLFSSDDTEIEIIIRNVLSQEVYRITDKAKKGVHKMAIPIYSLSEGSYVLQIKSAAFYTTTQKQFLVK